MDKQLPDPMDQIFPMIVVALESWKQEFNVEKIKEDIYSRMNKSQQEILLKLLGFDKDSWDGHWKLDHCNGRNGNSTAGEYLKSVQAEAVKEWLGKIPMPTMTDELKEKLANQMQKEFEYTLLNKAKDIAQNAANEQLKELKDKLLTTNIVDKYFKAIDLIKG